MSGKSSRRAQSIAVVVFFFGVVGLSWPLLEIPFAPCQAQLVGLSASLLKRCALQPLLWIFGLWLLLLVALWLLRGRRSGRRRPQAPRHD